MCLTLEGREIGSMQVLKNKLKKIDGKGYKEGYSRNV